MQKRATNRNLKRTTRMVLRFPSSLIVPLSGRRCKGERVFALMVQPSAHEYHYGTLASRAI